MATALVEPMAIFRLLKQVAVHARRALQGKDVERGWYG